MLPVSQGHGGGGRNSSTKRASRPVPVACWRTCSRSRTSMASFIARATVAFPATTCVRRSSPRGPARARFCRRTRPSVMESARLRGPDQKLNDRLDERLGRSGAHRSGDLSQRGRPATDLRGALRCDSERGRPGRRNMRPRRFKNPREQLHELCLSLLPAWSAAAGLQQMGADKPTQLMLVKPGSRASARRSIRAAFIGTAAAFAAPTKIRTPSRRGRTRRPRSSSIRLDLRGTLVGHGPEGQHACSGDFSSPRAQGSRAVPSN